MNLELVFLFLSVAQCEFYYKWCDSVLQTHYFLFCMTSILFLIAHFSHKVKSNVF